MSIQPHDLIETSAKYSQLFLQKRCKALDIADDFRGGGHFIAMEMGFNRLHMAEIGSLVQIGIFG